MEKELSLQEERLVVNGVDVTSLFNYGIAGVVIVWFMWRDSQRTAELIKTVAALEKAVSQSRSGGGEE